MKPSSPRRGESFYVEGKRLIFPQTVLQFPRIERRQVLADLLKDQSARLLAQIRFDHAQKFWLDGES